MKLSRSIIALVCALFVTPAFGQANQGASPLTGPKGGTNNAFMQFTGPASSMKTYTLPNASGTINLLNAAQTITAAKTFNDLTLLLAGSSSGTTTLKAGAAASGTLTLPAATDTLVGRNTVDTLTNKTLTAPAITAPTGIVKADVGLGNVDNTSDATKNAAVATLTNKTLTSPTINGGAINNTSIGFTSPLLGRFTSLEAVQYLKLSSSITPPQITANTDDYAPTGFATASVLRLESDSARSLNGLAGGTDGRMVIIHNVGSNDLVLKNEAGTSTAANRFALGADVALTAGTSSTLRYDGTSSRWRAIAGAGSGSGGGGSGTVTSITAGNCMQGGTITTSGTLGWSDECRQNVLIDRIYQSKMLADYRRGINTVSFGFKSAAGIDAGTSSNYSLDTSGGKVAPSKYTDQTPGTSGANNSSSAYTIVDRSYNIPAGTIISRIGIFSNVAGTGLKVKIVSRTSPTAVTVTLSEGPYNHTGTGWEYFNLSSPYTIPSDGATYNVAYYIASGGQTSGQHSHLRSFKQFEWNPTDGVQTYSADTAGTMATAAIGVSDNMTLITASQTSDSSVSNARALILYNPIDTVAPNTDLTVDVSCDGSTWSPASLSAASSYVGGSTQYRLAETADISCAAGTSFKARLKTLNNKAVEIYGLSLTVR